MANRLPLTVHRLPFTFYNKKPLNPPIQGFGTRFMGTGLFKIFLGKLLLPYVFDSLWKVSDLLFTAINYTSKTLLESCLSAVITAITLAV